uniref:C2H2-type domain-containing protein n=1 Tax=Ciona intestinalis TaxID=7719 RepID=H2XYP9_CIOIN
MSPKKTKKFNKPVANKKWSPVTEVKQEIVEALPFPAEENKDEENTNKLRKTRSHTRKENGLPKLICSICNKTFQSQKRLANHMKLHDEDDQFSCEISFTDLCVMELTEPETAETNEGEGMKAEVEVTVDDAVPIFKPEKIKMFRTIDYRGRPKGKEMKTCPTCGKTFESTAKTKQHMRRVHAEVKNFQCKDCDKKFCTRSNLCSHMLVHSGERAYQCASCNHAFKTRLALKRHFLTHTGERPYKCPYCDKTFRLSSTLIRHRDAHVKEKKYSCDICGKNFHQKVNLKQHLLIHTGEKPFSCKFCSKSFTQGSNLKSHVYKMHS